MIQIHNAQGIALCFLVLLHYQILKPGWDDRAHLQRIWGYCRFWERIRFVLIFAVLIAVLVAADWVIVKLIMEW